MDLVPYAVPLFLLAIGIELVWGWRRGSNTYRINDAISSLFLGTMSTLEKALALGVGVAIYHLLQQRYASWQLDVGHWGTWVFALVAYDFCYYWLHRLGHERSVLWAAHVAHHQSEDYNLSTALRQTSSGWLLSWIFYVPLYVLGVPAAVVLTVGSLNLIYQFWVHTQHVPKLGWFEKVFVTPSNHRVHHAQNPRYLDRNYGGIFILWDRLFGTFQEELDQEPCVYGIRGALRSWNPVWANLHIYVGLVQDSWRTRRWRDKLRVWFGRTGWRPDDVGGVNEKAKAWDPAGFQKFDPPVSRITAGYALVQLTVVVALGSALLFQALPAGAMMLACAAAMVATMVTTALWLEGRRQASLLDGLRLLLVVAGVVATEMPLLPTVLLSMYVTANLLALPLLVRAQRGMDALSGPSFGTAPVRSTPQSTG